MTLLANITEEQQQKKKRITTFRRRKGRANTDSEQQKKKNWACKITERVENGIHGIHKKVIERNWQNEIIMYYTMHRYICRLCPHNLTFNNAFGCVRTRCAEGVGFYLIFVVFIFISTFPCSVLCALPLPHYRFAMATCECVSQK